MSIKHHDHSSLNHAAKVIEIDGEIMPYTTHAEGREDVWGEIGYDQPYDPSDMTVDQARTLRDQEVGGPDAARIAKRADDLALFDADLGQPEGIQQRTSEAELVSARRWEARVSADIQALKDQHEAQPSPELMARLERRKKVHLGILERIERLELPTKLQAIDDDIQQTTDRREQAASGAIHGRETNRLDVLAQQRLNALAKMAKHSINVESE